MRTHTGTNPGGATNTGRNSSPTCDRPAVGYVESRHGFTLVELLVVIAVIAVLMALLAPAMDQARDIAISASCLAKQRGIGQAAMTHAADHHGRLPLAGLQWGEKVDAFTPEGFGDPAERNWLYYTDHGTRRVAPMVAQLGVYMGLEFRTDSREHMEQDINRPEAEQLFHDPAFAQVMRGNILLGRYGGYRDTIRPEPTSYAFSEGILGYRGATTHATVDEFPAGRISRIQRASATLFMIDAIPPDGDSQVFFDVRTDGDSHATFYEYWFYNEVTTVNQYGVSWGAKIDFGRHGQVMNAAFADGSARSIPVGQADDMRVDGLSEIYVLY